MRASSCTADTLSRSPQKDAITHGDVLFEEDIKLMVNQVEADLPASKEKFVEIVNRQKNDVTLMKVRNFILNGWPSKVNNPFLSAYFKFRADLHIINGMILKSNKILIPKEMKQEVLLKIHQGHLGISKCQRKGR